jgi:predicted O-methyltransferase YrrM
MLHAEAPVAGSPHVFIATPAITFHGNYLFSIAKSLPILAQEGIAADYCLLLEHCHVDDSRNSIVRQFLKTDCTDLIFIDADVGWRTEDLIKLCRYDRDMVGGVYPLKQKEEGFPIRMKPDEPIYADKDGLVKAEGLPTGFLKIKRRVFEELIKTNPNKFWGRDDDKNDIPHYIFFERTFQEFTRFSGDYAFCKKWQALGGEMFVDPEMVFTHEGANSWEGSLGDYWKRTNGVYQMQFDNAVESLRNGNDSADVFSALVQGYDNPYTATPEYLFAAYKVALETKAPILECGSGLTTLVLAIAAEKTGQEVYALEHEPAWLHKTQEMLDKYGLNKENINLKFSPLTDYGDFKWYITPPPMNYGLVLCDGPQRKHGRSGLYKVLGDSMQNAIVLADDADDPQEVKNITEWSQANNRTVSILGKQRQFAISMRKAA